MEDQVINGTYFNIKLFNTNAVPASAVWDGATANVTVSGGSVTAVNIVEGGSAYTNGEQYSLTVHQSLMVVLL